MSGSVPPTQPPPPPPPPSSQSQVSVLSPGIAGLFIQGIESGLVIAQFSQWFAALDRSESSVLTTTVIFVTIVGLAQSGICFASAWRTYVVQFGMFVLPGWEDYVQPLPTLFISVPVQALMIQRCYYLVGKSMFIITPLVLLLVGLIVMTVWSIISIFHFYTVIVANAKDPLNVLRVVGISWPFLIPRPYTLWHLALLSYPNDEAGVCDPYTQANISSYEHRVAICPATDSLRHLRVRTLYSIHDRASNTITALDAGCPADDREALRSFPILHGQRSTATTGRAPYDVHVDPYCANGGIISGRPRGRRCAR